MRRFRLGQSGLIEEAARQVVAQADPVARRIVSEERVRVAAAVKKSLPFVGLSAAALLGSNYLITDKKARALGYLASAGLATAGIWMAVDTISEGQQQMQAQQAAPSGLTALTQPVADQFARAVVTEAEPRVKEIVQAEKTRLAETAGTALPWTALSAVAFLGTAFFVPESSNVGKAAGYAASAALLIGGLWSALGKAA